MQRWSPNERIEMLGNRRPGPPHRHRVVQPARRARAATCIPKFVTVLLNDLFGIQSRAGCSCAGPYGHRLLGIDEPTSELYRDWVRKGFQGIKPGWCRVGFHYAMDDAERRYIMDAVEFVAEHGHRFLPLYAFDPATGMWTHREFHERTSGFRSKRRSNPGAASEPRCRRGARAALCGMPAGGAGQWPRRLGEPAAGSCSKAFEFGELQFFNL